MTVAEAYASGRQGETTWSVSEGSSPRDGVLDNHPLFDNIRCRHGSTVDVRGCCGGDDGRRVLEAWVLRGGDLRTPPGPEGSNGKDHPGAAGALNPQYASGIVFGGERG